MEHTYVIKAGDKFIAVDEASGGCPFETDRLDMARLWYGEKRAREYMAVINWNGSHSHWKLVRVITQDV